MVLNQRPDQYVPAGVSGPDFDLGVGGNIRQLYKTFLDGSEKGVIITDTGTREVAPEVVAMLKAILQAGCCRIEERATACRTVFNQCLPANDKQEFVGLFDEDTKDQWLKAIYTAVKKEWGM